MPVVTGFAAAERTPCSRWISTVAMRSQTLGALPLHRRMWLTRASLDVEWAGNLRDPGQSAKAEYLDPTVKRGVDVVSTKNVERALVVVTCAAPRPASPTRRASCPRAPCTPFRC